MEIGDLSGLGACADLAQTIVERIVPPKATEAEKAAAATQVQELLNTAEESRLKDIQSARSREVEITKATGKRDINLYVLAWTVIVGFFVLMGFLIFAKLPTANIGPVNQLFGALAAGFGMVLQYFFGSSKGSADKTAAMLGKGKS